MTKMIVKDLDYNDSYFIKVTDDIVKFIDWYKHHYFFRENVDFSNFSEKDIEWERIGK